MIAGLCRQDGAGVPRSRDCARHGYHAGMLSLAPMKGASIDELVEHCAAVAAEIPLVGFYLQTAVGGIAVAGGVLAAASPRSTT